MFTGLTVKLCVRQHLTSQPCREPPLAGLCTLLRKEMMTVLLREIQSLRPEEMGGTGFARLAGRRAFWSPAGAAVRCHIRILPRAEQQKKCYVNPQYYCLVPVMPEVHFLMLTMPVQHPCMTRLSASRLLCKCFVYSPAGLFL